METHFCYIPVCVLMEENSWQTKLLPKTLMILVIFYETSFVCVIVCVCCFNVLTFSYLYTSPVLLPIDIFLLFFYKTWVKSHVYQIGVTIAGSMLTGEGLTS